VYFARAALFLWLIDRLFGRRGAAEVDLYSTRIAYLLWLGTFFGFSGLHRFYMGKIGTGIIWLLTWGLFGLGSLYDVVTMPQQIREARLKNRVRWALAGEEYDDDDFPFSSRRALPSSPEERESPELVILKVAKSNHGLASPAEVALQGEMSTDAARENLDTLVNKGICEVRVKKNGSVTYAFPDFLDEAGAQELEQY
jgi:hypothetical protein